LENIYLKLNVNGSSKIGMDTSSPEVSWMYKCKMCERRENVNSNDAVVVVAVVTLAVSKLT
jgi:hypothetical protein